MDSHATYFNFHGQVKANQLQQFINITLVLIIILAQIQNYIIAWCKVQCDIGGKVYTTGSYNTGGFMVL